MVCWFFKFWHYFDFVKRVKFGVSGHFLENAWREWPEILYSDVSWPPSELIRLWSWSVDFPPFGSTLRFPGISRRTHGVNGLNFCMLMYLDHLQNWLDYGYCLLIFLLLAPLWLRETGQIWGFQHFPENAWREWPEILYGDVSWPLSELIRLWSWSVDF